MVIAELGGLALTQPSERTDAMLCHSFHGGTTAEVLERHVNTLKAKRALPSKR